MRITCPPITHPATSASTWATTTSWSPPSSPIEEIRDRIKADSLAFLSLDRMMRAIDRESGYCNACFTGRYPIEVGEAQGKLNFEGVLA